GVLGVLDSVDQSLLPAGDMPEHPAGFEVERWQQFAGVEDAQSAGGAGSEVVDTAASAHALCRDVDELGQLRQGGGDRVDDGVVLRVEHLQHPERVELVEAGAGSACSAPSGSSSSRPELAGVRCSVGDSRGPCGAGWGCGESGWGCREPDWDCGEPGWDGVIGACLLPPR